MAVREKAKILLTKFDYRVFNFAKHIAMAKSPGSRPLRLVSILKFSLQCVQISKRELAKNAEKSDIIWFAHDLYSVPVCWFLQKRYGGIFIHDIVELSLQRVRIRPPGWFSRKIILLVEKLACRSNIVFSGDPYLSKDFEARHKKIKCVEVLNCPNFDDNEPSINVKDYFVGANCSNLIIYVGLVAQHRGLEQTISALAHTKERVGFAIMGPASSEAQRKLIDLSKDMGLEGRVRLIDSVPHTQVVGICKTADAGISPVSGRFGASANVLNNKVLQYVAAGIPILCSDVPGVGGFVLQNEIGLLFDEQDPKSIAMAIDKIFEPKTLKQVSQNTLETAKIYNAESQNKVFEEELGHVIDKHHKNRIKEVYYISYKELINHPRSHRFCESLNNRGYEIYMIGIGNSIKRHYTKSGTLWQLRRPNHVLSFARLLSSPIRKLKKLF